MMKFECNPRAVDYLLPLDNSNQTMNPLHVNFSGILGRILRLWFHHGARRVPIGLFLQVRVDRLYDLALFLVDNRWNNRTDNGYPGFVQFSRKQSIRHEQRKNR